VRFVNCALPKALFGKLTAVTGQDIRKISRSKTMGNYFSSIQTFIKHLDVV